MKKIAVVGSGLTGLWTAQNLSESGFDVTLLESREVAGGRYRREREESPFETPDLDFFAGDEAHESFLKTLSKRVPDTFDWVIEPHQALTHIHGEWRGFVGFGDDPATSVDLLSKWNSSSQLEMTPKASSLVAKLLEDPPFKVLLRSEITHIEVEKESVTSITVNGSTQMAVDELVFCPSPSRLLELLSHEALKSSTRSRLARAHGWTGIFLRLDHSEEVSEKESVRFLLGTGKDLEPAVGRVFKNHSKWMSLIPIEKAMEPDYVTHQIRAIKRVLKRHMPDLLEKTEKEHIFIQDEAYGSLDLKLKNPQKFNEISNLWLANHRFSPLLGSLGELQTAEAVLAELLVAEPQSSVLTEQQL